MKKERIPHIEVMPQSVFDRLCAENNINDSNVETEFSNNAFISIIGTPECLKYYLEEDDTKHWFESNHSNVINLDFDDIPCDEFEYNGHIFKGITIKQAEELFDFIEKNVGKDFFIHCRAGRSRSMAIGTFIRDFYKEIYRGKYETLFEGSNLDVYSKLSRIFYTKNKIYNDTESKENS